MTSVVISQPMYFPWPGFLEHMALADAYIWLDDAQFTNRIQVLLPGGAKWMSIPLDGKGSFRPISALKADAEDWRKSHREMLRQSFRDRPHCEEALSLFDKALSHDVLCDVLIASAEGPARFMGALRCHPVRSSTMNVEGTSWQRVLEMVKAVGGTRYITGHGAARYLDHEAFERANVQVEYIDYSLCAWPQPQGFTPYVTALDLVAARGAEACHTLRPQTVSWRAFLERKKASQE
jgi:hypothetical protein